MFLHGGARKFSKKVEAKNESDAKHLVFSLLGSQHGLKQSKIKILEVKGG